MAIMRIRVNENRSKCRESAMMQRTRFCERIAGVRWALHLIPVLWSDA